MQYNTFFPWMDHGKTHTNLWHQDSLKCQFQWQIKRRPISKLNEKNLRSQNIKKKKSKVSNKKSGNDFRQKITTITIKMLNKRKEKDKISTNTTRFTTKAQIIAHTMQIKHSSCWLNIKPSIIHSTINNIATSQKKTHKQHRWLCAKRKEWEW